MTRKLIYVDVRNRQTDFEKAHIPGAIHIPLYDLNEKASELLPDKQIPIRVYCQTGLISCRGASILKYLGYENATDFGGLHKYKGRLRQSYRSVFLEFYGSSGNHTRFI